MNPISTKGPSAVAAMLVFPALCMAQGTLTFTFDGASRGTELVVGTYFESGARFSPIAPGNLLLNGGGISGYPDNDTSYLEVPDGYPGSGGLTFGFTNAFPSIYFNLVSFDAAEYDSAGPQTLQVVGYKPMAGTVTNSFSVSSLSFQTFTLDSSFVNLYRVDVYNARWSLDNLVISGVPEPSACALTAVGGLCWFARRRMLRRRTR
jgi:hypothetical protein